jgi:hypothetical protein
MERTVTYLYCVVYAEKLQRLSRVPEGIPGADRARACAAGRFVWAILADVPLDTYGSGALEDALQDLQWVGRVALAHETLVEHFSRQRQSTVVPMQLFTMFSNEDRAVAETRARRPEIVAIVKRISGCQEWGVRIMRRPAGVVKPAVGTARAQSGAAFLAARKQARDAARDMLLAAAEHADQAYETLAAIARDARRRQDAPPAGAVAPLLDAAFLVPEARRARFKTAARRLASGTGAGELTLSGPWPAYNFVQPRRI